MSSFNTSDARAVDKSPHTEMEIVPKDRSIDDEDVADTYHQSLKGHTKDDKADMSRMGKIQELRVNPPPRSLPLAHSPSSAANKMSSRETIVPYPRSPSLSLFREHGRFS